MKDWKAVIRTWERNSFNQKPKQNNFDDIVSQQFDAIRRKHGDI